MKSLIAWAVAASAAALILVLVRFDAPSGPLGEFRQWMIGIGLALFGLVPLAAGDVDHFGWGFGLLFVLIAFIALYAIQCATVIAYSGYRFLRKGDRAARLELVKCLVGIVVLTGYGALDLAIARLKD